VDQGERLDVDVLDRCSLVPPSIPRSPPAPASLRSIALCTRCDGALDGGHRPSWRSAHFSGTFAIVGMGISLWRSSHSKRWSLHHRWCVAATPLLLSPLSSPNLSVVMLHYKTPHPNPSVLVPFSFFCNQAISSASLRAARRLRISFNLGSLCCAEARVGAGESLTMLAPRKWGVHFARRLSELEVCWLSCCTATFWREGQRDGQRSASVHRVSTREGSILAKYD
jgi:hypothetical protein